MGWKRLAAWSPQMKRFAARTIRTAGIAALLAGIGGAAWYHFRFDLLRNTIRELQDIPLGASVRLQGVVTAVDTAGSGFFLQDDTGALSLAQPPGAPAIHAGESLGIVAVKTAHYNDAIGPDSVALKSVRLYPLARHASLPPAAPIAPAYFPAGERAETRVAITAIVRAVTTDANLRSHLAIAQGGPEVDVILPRLFPDLAHLVDATVTVTGVPEGLSGGSAIPPRLWVNSPGDIRVDHPPPPTSPLANIRQLFGDESMRSGHRVQLRGHIAAWLTPDRLLLADPWGAIECRLSAPQRLPVGSSVEVSGFPGLDHLGIDLFHAQASAIPPTQAPDSAASPSGALTTVAAVSALPRGRAALALPVRITGVVTYNDADWEQLFLQDRTRGIFVRYSGAVPALRVGDKVTVIGLTNAGDFAPVLVAPRFIHDGTAPLPAPIPVTASQAASGMLDSQRVEIQGIVHPVDRTQPRHLGFELYADFGRVRVTAAPTFSIADLRRMEDARVSIRGVFGTVFNSRRQLVGYQLNVASPADIQVIEPATPDPFSLPATAVGALLGYSPQARFGHRIKVSGTVTMVEPGSLYLQDDSGGVQVRGDTAGLHRGDLVDALGYPTVVGRYSPVLTDAVFRPLGRKVLATAKSATIDDLLRGRYDSQLVTVEGKLLDAIDEPSGKSLLLQSGIHTFSAQLGKTDSHRKNWPPQVGSVLRLTGISTADVDPDKIYLLLQQQPISFRILLRTTSDVAVLKAPPFWNLRNAFLLIVTFAFAILAALVWGGALRRRLELQRLALRRAAETNQAIADLSCAMNEVSDRQEFDAQVSVRGTPEVARLVVGFNTMLTELRLAQRASRDAEARLMQQALTDELTGLPNRRHLSEHLAQSLALARRNGTLMALLYIDLDGFKLVNDSFGHAAGDLLLTEVAERLRARTRKSDSLARIGGDEFTVILNGIGQREDAQTAADDMLRALSQPFEIAGQDMTIGASIGICTFPDHANDETDLLQQADSAMYAAKRAGRNRAMFFTSDLGHAIRERLTIENELRRALLEHRGITVHYQPEFDLTTGALTRFEALARWNHPTLGVIPPSTFIPIAEESGLIISLGAWIMERACTEAVSWQTATGKPVQVAVNVSSVQFARDTFVDEVMETIQRTGLDPHLLQIELTESSMLIGVQRAAHAMKVLRSLGVSFAIDDFGTGYSCLSYLPELAFDALKIDRVFVKDLIQRPETRAMVRSLISLAQELGMRIIFEGIETSEQLQIIETMGAHEAQGYLLGRPNPHPATLLGQSLPMILAS